jgi:hypothetical protein
VKVDVKDLYETILIETAITEGFSIVHVPPHVLKTLERDRIWEAGLLLHAAEPATEEDLDVALKFSNQFTTNDIEWALAGLRRTATD